MVTVKADPSTVHVEFDHVQACELADDIERAASVLDDEGCQDRDKERVRRLVLLAALLRHEAGHLLLALQGRVPGELPHIPDLQVDRPTDPCPPSFPVAGEHEADGGDTATELPRFIDVVASHIDPTNREFTVRIYRCDASDRRDPNEALARVFPTEAKARQFYLSTQNIWNMKVRAKEAPAYDVVLGVQDSRKHAKKKSYREWEHALCKGGPG